MRRLHSPSPIVTARMDLVYYEKKIRQSLLWGSINSFLLIIVIYNLNYYHTFLGSPWHKSKLCFGIVLFFSLVFHIFRFLYLTCKKVKKPEETVKKTDDSNEIKTVNELEFSCFQRSNREIVHSDPSSNFPIYTSTPVNRFHGGPICSMLELDRYLKEYERAEKEKQLVENYNPSSSNPLELSRTNSFDSKKGWEQHMLQENCKTSLFLSYTDSKYPPVNQCWGSPEVLPNDSSPVHRRNLYQLSLSASDSGHSLNDDGGSPIFQKNFELWLKFKINPTNVVSWVGNLRMWISKTILQRVVDEIDVVNTGLRKQGLAGLTVGNVGLDTLTNTAHNIIVTYNIPTLPFLIPFLQVSSNQQYIVQRIKELAVGSSMSDYKWKSGGKCDDKEWEPHIPTDAELVMHLVSTYLDSQLPLLPSQPEARPFTTKYLIKVKEQPKQMELAIRQQCVNPPHYDLILNGEIQDIPQVSQQKIVHSI